MPVLQARKKVNRTFGEAAGLKRNITKFRPQVRSRHPSHEPLRMGLGHLPFRSVIRLGSTTDLPDTVTHNGLRIECNTVQSVKNSASKFLMKKCFDEAKVRTAKWLKANEVLRTDDQKIYNYNRNSTLTANQQITLKFPLVAKLNFGSRGQGMHLLRTISDYNTFVNSNRSRLNEYLFEEYHNYVREYRLHVTALGCFYACRKMLREGAEDRWYRNDSNCVWIVESNPEFQKPRNWSDIEAECVKALKAVKLDIGACDVRVQAQNGDGKFIIVEINSAPSFGKITLQKYIEQLPKLLKIKKAANE